MGSTSPHDWVSEPIAIVGLSCKFAGEARTPQKFWEMLAAGRNAWSEIPYSRFNLKGAYHPKHDKLSTVHVRGGHFIEEDLGLFDAPFFNFSGEVAATMDPGFRLQLESVYEALENAGLTLPDVAGTNTSVYAALFTHDYRQGMYMDEDTLPRLLQTGTGEAMSSNRVSHFFDLRGASYTLDTGCSGGMVAIHQGVQDLRSRQSDMALVCGSSIILDPGLFKSMGSLGLLSPDGKSYAFDSRANGYGRGEGIATLAIKRLSDAIAAGDPIRAVIRESALNQDGKTETITTPSGDAQVALMRDCYRRAGLNPVDTQYFEAHGTGTATGDPIECRAIATVFQDGRTAEEPLRIGSVKTNIGHTESVSGIASIVKVVLALEHGKIPPSVNYEKPNPKLSLEEWRLRVVTELEDWTPSPIGTRRASINNFGYGGTNAHIIIEGGEFWQNKLLSPAVNGTPLVNGTSLTNGTTHADEPGYVNGAANVDETVHINGNGAVPDAPTTVKGMALSSQLLLLSARDEPALKRTVSNLKDYLEQASVLPEEEQTFLQGLVYTLCERRTRFSSISSHPVPVASGIEGVIQILESPKFTPRRVTRVPRVGMVFTGQGAQWFAMGRELIDVYPIFQASLQEADAYLKDLGAGWSLMQELCRDAETSRVNEVELSTPLCVALQISLVRLLEAWGVRPVAVTSHSSGEIAAAYTVGALSYPAAMAVSYHRAVLAADKRFRGPVKGAMIAMGLGLEETEQCLARLTGDGQAVVACINSPSSITVSGDETAVMALESLAKEDGVFARRLKVETAFHSHHMSAIAEAYGEALQGLSCSASDEDENPIAFSSPVTGGRIGIFDEIAEPDYWVQSLVQPVQFVDAFTDMVLGDCDASGTSVDVIVEVGPHTALGGPIKQILGQPEFENLQLPYLGCLVRNTSAVASMQTLAANLLVEGAPIAVEAVNFPRGRPSSVRVLTDLPSYPWHHETRHWFEPRFTRALKSRAQPPHSLLGSLVLGSDVERPTWRHLLTLTEAPWLREHVVQGSVLYPGAGFMCLALEAMRQLADLEQKNMQTIAGYRLKDVDILQALVVPDTGEGIEIQTSLEPVTKQDIGNRGWRQFEVRSVTLDNEWTTHARGLVISEWADAPDVTIPSPRADQLSGYTKRPRSLELYTSLQSMGIHHGPVFQAIDAIEQAGNMQCAHTSFHVPDASVPIDLPHQPLIHPTTLDVVIQTIYAPLLGSGGEEDGAKVPRSFGNLWLSAGLNHKAGRAFKAFTTMHHSDSQSLRADITVVDGEDATALPVLEIHNAVCQSLGRSAPTATGNPWDKELCMSLQWDTDLSMASDTTLDRVKKGLQHALEPEEADIIVDLRRACLYFVADALAELAAAASPVTLPNHLLKLQAWGKQLIAAAKNGELDAESKSWLEDSPETRQTILDRVKGASVNGEMVCQLGPHLAAIMRQEKEPLEVMMEDKLLYRYYTNILKGERAIGQSAVLLKHLVHKNPRTRILEIGAGTGGMTRQMLPVIGTSETGGPRAELYHYTDISSGFFEAAQGQFAAWEDVMRYDPLDIEADPAAQGFELGSYDIVIACEVLHATKSMATTMAHVRQLMKPSGTLLLLETTQDQVDIQFVFGTLPGWWLSVEPQRALTPSLSVEFWDEILKGAGFTGVDFQVRDCESDELYALSTIMSTATPAPVKSVQVSDPVVVVTRQEAPPDPQWLSALQAGLTLGDVPPAVLEFETATPDLYKDKISVFIGEIGEPLLYTLDAVGLERVKAMALQSRGLLWVTRGGTVNCERPEMAMAQGLLRTLRHEYVGHKFVTLDLDPNGPTPWTDAGVAAITKVIAETFGSVEVQTSTSNATEAPADELEYAERDGDILVPRLLWDHQRNQIMMANQSVDWASSEAIPHEPFFQVDRPLRLQVGVQGLLDTLAFTDDPNAAAAAKSRIDPDLLEIEPRAYGVNFRDIMVAMGQLEEQVLGLECSGVVTRVGCRAAAHGYAIGDEVFAFVGGSNFASRPRTSWKLAMHIPPGISFEEAASVPVLFATVYMCFYQVAHLEKGQSVLIHAAAGGIGQVAIQLAQRLGAEIYATVGTPEKRALIMEQYGIPEDRIFSSRDSSFARGILAATNGRGVDVVLNSLSGPLLQESFNLVAPFGHFLEIGKRDLEQNSLLAMRTFSRHVSFHSLDLLSYSRHRAPAIHKILAEVGRLLETKEVRPVYPVTAYPLAEISRAFRTLQAGKHTGKVVLSVSPGDQVPALPRSTTAQLRPDASYILVGGVGGIGRSVSHWLAAHGARHLIILSRSAGTSAQAAALAAELQPTGCRMKPISCDVADEASLASALQTCRDENFPPIRGVIQSAMVLQDSIFEQMTLADYQAAVRPKVNASWNLHSQLQAAELDFFIFLSSMSGVYGYPSQSNYGAGGAYEDALAHWRVSQGLPAVALDLGPVKGVGYVAETGGVIERMTKAGHYPVTEEQMLRALESAILSPRDKQVMVGVNAAPGPHWERHGDSQLGRDMRYQALRCHHRAAGQAQRDGAGAGAGGGSSLASQLSEVTSRDQAEEVLGEAIAQKLANIFMIPVDDIDSSKHPSAYGVDSLVAVELRNMLALHAAAEVSIFNIMQSPSLAALAGEVVLKSAHVNPVVLP